MNGYEIRILDARRRAVATILTAHVSDFAAVRSARKLAGNRLVEVWRDLECIYRNATNAPVHRHHAA